MSARQREARCRLFQRQGTTRETPIVGLQATKRFKPTAAETGQAGMASAPGPLTVHTVGGVRSVSRSGPTEVVCSPPGPSYEERPASPFIDVEGDDEDVVGSLFPSEEEDMFAADQQEKGELDERRSPLLQGLISRAAAALGVEVPAIQGLGPSRFDDDKGGSQSSTRFLVPLLSDFEEVVRNNLKPHGQWVTGLGSVGPWLQFTLQRGSVVGRHPPWMQRWQLSWLPQSQFWGKGRAGARTAT